MSLSYLFIRSMYKRIMWGFDLFCGAFGAESQMPFSMSVCFPVILTLLNLDHLVRRIYRMSYRVRGVGDGHYYLLCCDYGS